MSLECVLSENVSTNPPPLSASISSHALVGFGEEIIVTFLAQLLEVLKTLRSKKVFHRDIKAENICLQENGNLVLVDFELAVVLGREQGQEGEESHEDRIFEDNLLVGSSPYTAPETYQRLEYSYETDLWAVGIMAYELHGPHFPWSIDKSMTPEEVGRTIMASRPTRPQGMSETLWRFLSRILVAKDLRISLEEAMDDPLFASFRFADRTPGGQGADGNVFDTHACLAPIRDLCASRGLQSFADRIPPDRRRMIYRDAETKSQSRLVDSDREEVLLALTKSGE